MPFKWIEAAKLYAKEPKLKKQDVEILQEWLKKQAHLPKIKEMQIAVVLYGCYYQIETAKAIIDNYFTVRSFCPEIFVALSSKVLASVMPTAFINVLPKKTPEGYDVFMIKLLDSKPEKFNCANFINLAYMTSILYIHQVGIIEGAIVLLDMKEFSIGHMGKLDLNAIKYALCIAQAGIPLRLKGIHIMNSIPLSDKFLALVKPFMSEDIYNLIHFHPSNSEGLYDVVPLECMPKEYGGQAPSILDLNDQSLKNLVENYDFFEFHNDQKADESKRVTLPEVVNNVFGVEGTFKKLEID